MTSRDVSSFLFCFARSLIYLTKLPNTDRLMTGKFNKRILGFTVYKQV